MSTTDGFRADWAQKDFYKQLGVTKDASADEVKKAYRKLARANHPDSNPGDSADSRAKHDKFKAVAEAYDVLGDPDKRAKYDEMRQHFGSGGLRGGFPGTAGPGGVGFDLNDLLRDQAGRGGGFGDMFGDLFGRGRQQRTRSQKGADVETTATIGFTDAIEGVTISLRLTADAPCPDCKGTGGKPGTKPKVCPECEGAGFVTGSAGGAFSINETCPGLRRPPARVRRPRARPATATAAACPRAPSRPASPPGSRTARRSGSAARARPARPAVLPATCSSR